MNTLDLASYGPVIPVIVINKVEDAVPMAESPATPAPITKTFAGGTFPAAVIWPVKKRPK